MAPEAQQRRKGGGGPTRWFGGTAWAVAFVLALVSSGYGQDQPDQKVASAVSISNIEAGFSDGASSVVRADYYAPISIQVRNRTGGRFYGTLQVISRDRDGETVIHELPDFGVDAGVVEDKQFDFFARNPGMFTSSTDVSVRLLDRNDGRLVASETARLEYLKESEHLILDISPQSIKAVIQAALPNEPDQRFRGQVRTVSMRPDRLPGFWHELEAVDVIVCDQPDDLGLNDKSDTLRVLAQWVRQGGSLVLGPGSLQSFGESDLGKALPAKPVAARRLGPGKVRLGGLNTSGLTVDLARETGIWQLRPSAGATTLLALPADGDKAQQPQARAEAAPVREGAKSAVVVRRRLGLGSIVQSGISLKTLLAASSEEATKAGSLGTRIKPEIFGIRTLGDKPEQQTGVSYGMSPNWPSGQGPSELLQGQADFRATGTVLATLLMLLIVVYGLVATVGTWLVLKRRNLTQFSWLAFAGVAIIGSVGAAMLVQSARGIWADVKQQSVIDIDGATGMAHVHTLYGLKMPYDTRSDIGVTTMGHDEMPPDQLKDAYIRPASDLERSSGDSFAVKRDYTIRYGQAQVSAVPVRATVKQFESYWYGPMGTMQATLQVQPGGKLSDTSRIVNNTDLNLRECYLVYSSAASFNPSQRDALIDVVRIDRLPAGKTRGDLAMLADAQSGEGGATRLDKVSGNWLKSIPMEMPNRRGMQPYETPVDRTDATRVLAATMISVLSDLPSVDQSVFQSTTKLRPFTDLPREGARWLDLRNVLDGRSAVLIGLADVPGPMRLQVNGKAVLPSSGECIVRVVLPMTVAASSE